jgi:DNA-binding transcriptional MerR regulator
MNTVTQPEFVNEQGASTLIGISAATLRTYRCRGGGPPFYKPARQVLYSVAELRAWVEADRRLPAKKQ